MRESEPPAGLPAKEIIVLCDADAEKSLVHVFFDSEQDYQRGDGVLRGMPAADTPRSANGRREVRRRHPHHLVTADRLSSGTGPARPLGGLHR